VTAAPRLPEPLSSPGVRTVAPPPPTEARATDAERLAARWAALAGRPTGMPSERSPLLHARLVNLLQQIAARCRDEPFWPSRARRLGADVLRSGICGPPSGPRHPAEDVLAPTLALLRDEAPRVLGLSGTARRRLSAVLDELAAGFAAALRDRVHDEHQTLLRARLAEVAARDALTQLPNRSITEQRVRGAFAGSDGVGLCAVDLDGFGGVNDRLGRGVGDRLLVAVAARLRQAVAPHLLTRTGGDEFAVLVEEAPDAGAVHALGCRVRDALGTPFRIGDRTVTLSAAVGVALSAPETAGPAELMRAADVALSWAKAQGRGRVVLFDPDHDAAESARAGLLSQLGDGVARGEFRVHYQPLVGLADGRVRGAEALVRWQHPEHGLLPPSYFVAAAERSGAIVALDRWVLEQACAQAATWWRERGPAAPYVSVNVSPVELVEPGWAAEVARVIELTGVRPSQLQLEITEQAVLADEAASRAALRTLRDAGVRLALDDFGTGYSGLAWLRHLPVHAIKIDGSFVDGLRHAEPDAVDAAIILAMIRMAHSLGLEVTAEWVETARQADYLAALDCDLGQGRWFGQAGPAAWVLGVAPRTIGS
jgi:diguanylate cyclase (GGDEF)-like protein